MGIKADIINKVFDVLDVAQQSGTLQYVEPVVFGELATAHSLENAFLVVKLPPSDLTAEDWRETTNRKQELFNVEVGCHIQAPSDLDRPYGESGDDTKRGILTMIDDVQNEVENNFADICTANPGIVDFQSILVNMFKDDDSTWWHGTIMYVFKNQFAQGQR